VITGRINSFYEAVIPLHLQDTGGQVHEIEAILDTGFNGSLTLPSELITTLQLPWRTRGNAILANGSEETFDIYAAVVIWDGTPRPILAETVETAPLLGMRLLAGSDVHMIVEPGGRVQIVPLPEAGGSDVS
jgi:clan AA aspartic protease